MAIKRYALQQDQQNNYTLVVYLDPQLVEFSDELVSIQKNITNLQVQIRELIKEKFPYVPITTAKVIWGAMLVTTIYLEPNITKASAATTTNQVQQAGQYDVYKVQAGDTLTLIAKKYNVSIDSIKTVNGLTSDNIYVGQVLNLPFYTYTVVSGDTLYAIAKRFNVPVENIRSSNQLTSDSISIGQKLRIPKTPVQTATVLPDPTGELKAGTGTYTVMAGDSLYLISKKFSTTVSTLRSLNNLTADTVYIGQVLKLPQNQPTIPTIQTPPVTEPVPLPNNTPVVQPTPPPVTTAISTYTVVSGDTLFSIARRFNTTVDTIKTTNQLSTNIISIGQQLKIPISNPADTVPPSVPVLNPIGTISSSNSTSILVSGLAEANSTIAITITDGFTSPLTNQIKADATGKFEARVDGSNLKDGSITITAVATDLAGNRSPAALLSVNKDTVSLAPTQSAENSINQKNTSAFPITGKAEPGATVQITISDGFHPAITKQSIANDRGEFSAIFDVRNLNDGSIVISAKSVDLSGNESKGSTLTATKDTFAIEPVIDNKMQVSIENVRTYTLFGITDPGAKVELTISDGVNPALTATASANESGEFRTNVDLLSLNDGPLTITARAIDLLGNVSPYKQTTITKETSLVPPVIENTKQINSQTAVNYTIFGKARPQSTVNITVSDGINPNITASAIADQNGEFHATVNVSTLVDKALTIFASQTSLSGIKSQVGTATIAKDTSAPGAPIINNNNFINQENQQSFLLTGTGDPNILINVKAYNENGNNIQRIGQTNEAGQYNLPLDLSSLNDGNIIFEISQMDQAGNISPLTIKTLLKDTVGPTSLNLTPLPAIFSGNASNYRISGALEPQINFTMVITDGINKLTKTGTTDSNGNFDLTMDTSTLIDGNITLSFTATDVAGNTNTLQPVTLIKDTYVPAVAVPTFAPYVNSLNEHNFSISGASAEEGALVQMVISDGSTNITKTAAVASGSFSTSFDISSLKEGRLTLEVNQTDRAGNTSILQASTMIKDTIAESPIVSKSGFTFENQRSSVRVIGTAEPNASIYVSLLNANGVEVLTQSSTADSTGFYNLFIPLDQGNTLGIASAAVSQKDSAGNTSKVTADNLSGHTVAAGETLLSIAKRYNTTVDALKILNNLSSDVIYPNQFLRLPVSASEVMNLGYMYFGNSKDYLSMVNQTASSINTVSPSYFDINPDGTLKLTSSLDANFIAASHQQGIRIVPFLSNHWNRDIGRAILANKELAARQISDAVARYNLDGVNVDIENVTELDRSNYTEFVRLLRQMIPSTKEVSVSVAANPNGWTVGWHGSYDYTNLAKYADYLMIMSYDESYPGGTPGPVASIPWIEKSIQYALSQNVSANKIVMGVAHYGRYWIEGMSYGGFGISNWQVEDLIKTYNGTVIFDEKSQSPKAIITIKEGDPKTIVTGTVLAPGTYTIWYENEESILQKLSLVSKYNLRGVGNWSIGQEMEDIWGIYATTLPTTVPVITLPNSIDNAAIPVVPASTASYTVVSGDTLSAIARKYNTTVTAIKEQNQLTTDSIYIGQTLTIATSNTVVNTPVRTYTVVAGDTLYAIARRYSIAVTSLIEANNLTTDSLYISQILKIPGS
jgi:LysM repeat protein/D-Tyr-tRNAtyr deacylase